MLARGTVVQATCSGTCSGAEAGIGASCGVAESSEAAALSWSFWEASASGGQSVTVASRGGWGTLSPESPISRFLPEFHVDWLDCSARNVTLNAELSADSVSALV